jgi:hypothetical protein
MTNCLEDSIGPLEPYETLVEVPNEESSILEEIQRYRKNDNTINQWNIGYIRVFACFAPTTLKLPNNIVLCENIC